MQISSASSQSFDPTQASASIGNMKKLFQNLGSALNSGNLSDAKAALSQLQQNAPPGASNSNNPMSQQIDSLTKAINSGDLKSAQSAYSNIQKAVHPRSVSLE
jgi:soluble cytochrome b562